MKKASRPSSQSNGHRIGNFVIIQDKLAKLHVNYLFNYDFYPTSYGCVLGWTVTHCLQQGPIIVNA